MYVINNLKKTKQNKTKQNNKRLQFDGGQNVVPIEYTKTKLLSRLKRPLIFLILTQLHVSFDNDHHWAIITNPLSKVK